MTYALGATVAANAGSSEPGGMVDLVNIMLSSGQSGCRDKRETDDLQQVLITMNFTEADFVLIQDQMSSKRWNSTTQVGSISNNSDPKKPTTSLTSSDLYLNQSSPILDSSVQWNRDRSDLEELPRNMTPVILPVDQLSPISVNVPNVHLNQPSPIFPTLVQ